MSQRRRYLLIGTTIGIILGWIFGGFFGYSTIGIGIGALLGVYVANHLARGRGY